MPAQRIAGTGVLRDNDVELAGFSVFVAEDEALVAMNLEDMLRDLGCSVLGPAMRLDQAERMLEEGLACDAAILDINLGGEMVFPVAEKLRARGIPIIFTTGYGREGLPKEWHSENVLQKPYAAEDIAANLSAVLDRG